MAETEKLAFDVAGTLVEHIGTGRRGRLAFNTDRRLNFVNLRWDDGSGRLTKVLTKSLAFPDGRPTIYRD